MEHFSANSYNSLRFESCSGRQGIIIIMSDREVKFSNLARDLYLHSVVKLVVFATLLGVKISLFNVFCFDRFISILFHKLKPRPNDHNMPKQHIARLLRATCCVHLATVLRHVGCCWLKYEHFQS